MGNSLKTVEPEGFNLHLCLMLQHKEAKTLWSPDLEYKKERSKQKQANYRVSGKKKKKSTGKINDDENILGTRNKHYCTIYKLNFGSLTKRKKNLISKH